MWTFWHIIFYYCSVHFTILWIHYINIFCHPWQEQEIADSENLIASSSLETVNIRTRIERLKKILADLDFKISEQNAIITKSEVEIVKRNAVIERKQNQVDVINKKLTALINAAGVS